MMKTDLKPTIECVVEDIKKVYAWKTFPLEWCVLSYCCAMEEANRNDMASFIIAHKEEIIERI